MTADGATRRARLSGLARFVIEIWALLGGCILLALVLMNVESVIASAVWGAPFPGDFEMTQVGVAVAAFSFLPYCQLTGANVTADIFTSGLSKRWEAIFALVASLLALGFALLLAWRMWAGMLDQRAYDYTTTILQFPHWIAFIPILISLALLAVAALMTLDKAARDARET
ncbi:MAG TPA: TRAP transporter small permease subunit [Afifellaceae bacterium]|nr:TRAP transporter small permease subunit [Afifellaceae bacterium]